MRFLDKLNWHSFLLLVPSAILCAVFTNMASQNPDSPVLKVLAAISAATALASIIWMFISEIIDFFVFIGSMFLFFFGGFKRILSTACLALAGGAIYFAPRMPDGLYTILLFAAAAIFIVLAFILYWKGSLAVVGTGVLLSIGLTSDNIAVYIGCLIGIFVVLCIATAADTKKA